MADHADNIARAQSGLSIEVEVDDQDSFRKITGTCFRGCWTVILTARDGRQATVSGGKGQPFEPVVAAAVHALQIGAPRIAA